MSLKICFWVQLDQITSDMSSPHSRHRLISFGATSDSQIITSTRHASLKTWIHPEGTHRASSSAMPCFSHSHLGAARYSSSLLLLHHWAALIELLLINCLAQGQHVKGKRKRFMFTLHSQMFLYSHNLHLLLYTLWATPPSPFIYAKFALNCLSEFSLLKPSHTQTHLGPWINT